MEKVFKMKGLIICIVIALVSKSSGISEEKSKALSKSTMEPAAVYENIDEISPEPYRMPMTDSRSSNIISRNSKSIESSNSQKLNQHELAKTTAENQVRQFNLKKYMQHNLLNRLSINSNGKSQTMDSYLEAYRNEHEPYQDKEEEKQKRNLEIRYQQLNAKDRQSEKSDNKRKPEGGTNSQKTLTSQEQVSRKSNDKLSNNKKNVHAYNRVNDFPNSQWWQPLYRNHRNKRVNKINSLNFDPNVRYGRSYGQSATSYVPLVLNPNYVETSEELYKTINPSSSGLGHNAANAYTINGGYQPQQMYNQVSYGQANVIPHSIPQVGLPAPFKIQGNQYSTLQHDGTSTGLTFPQDAPQGLKPYPAILESQPHAQFAFNGQLPQHSSDLSALTALIGKPPSDQLHGLTALLHQEKTLNSDLRISNAYVNVKDSNIEIPALQVYPSFIDLTKNYGSVNQPNPFHTKGIDDAQRQLLEIKHVPSNYQLEHSQGQAPVDHIPITENVYDIADTRPKPEVKIQLTPQVPQVVAPVTPLNAVPRQITRSTHEENEDDNLQYAAGYAFGYRVRDYHSGNDYGHHQERAEGVTKGHYHVLLPDGRVQNVNYYADGTGFHSDVTYASIRDHN